MLRDHEGSTDGHQNLAEIPKPGVARNLRPLVQKGVVLDHLQDANGTCCVFGTLRNLWASHDMW